MFMDKGGLGRLSVKTRDQYKVDGEKNSYILYIMMKVRGLKSNSEHLASRMAVYIALKNRLICIWTDVAFFSPRHQAEVDVTELVPSSCQSKLPDTAPSLIFLQCGQIILCGENTVIKSVKKIWIHFKICILYPSF